MSEQQRVSKDYAITRETRVATREWRGEFRHDVEASAVKVRRVAPSPRNLSRAEMIRNIRSGR